MRTISVVRWLLIGLLGLSACKESVDIEPPTLDMIRFDPALGAGEVCGQPSQQVLVVQSGRTLELAFRATDNVALSQYKIDIHSNFDCHGHAGKTEDWSLQEVVDMEGTEQVINRSLTIPANVTAGNYHFEYQVIDAAGNEDQSGNIYDLQVQNVVDTVPPVMTVNGPTQSDLTATRGELVSFFGSVTDNYSLFEGGNGRVRLTYAATGGGNVFSGFEWRFTEGAAQEDLFSFGWQVPGTLTRGAYDLVLTPYDGVNNRGLAQRYTLQVE
jgi:hypothetical protein